MFARDLPAIGVEISNSILKVKVEGEGSLLLSLGPSGPIREMVTSLTREGFEEAEHRIPKHLLFSISVAFTEEGDIFIHSLETPYEKGENAQIFPKITPGEPFKIGRDPKNDLIIPNELNKFSANHLTLFYDAEARELFIEDHSRNGTLVSGRK
jgi:hypothetical protein